LFERASLGHDVILVQIRFPRDEAADSEEFSVLAASAGATVLKKITLSRQKPGAKYFIGSGQARAIHDDVELLNPQVVIFSHPLSPAQERNLERILCCRVLDRTGLILDIFASRARTFEGKLQVELAQLQYMATRLVRGWTHLERQKGGIGLRGPGETQLETDRRLLRDRVRYIQGRLDKVHKHRNLSRGARARSSTPSVSLVGYTNAGKSSLFNCLTDAKVYAADQLFATLDPTLRKMIIPHVGDVVIADTVGFIRHLPHDLVASFQATLEETCQADLLLHVIDVSDEKWQDYVEAVDVVISEIGAEKVPALLVFNKIDLTDFEPHIDYDEEHCPKRVWLSAQTGEGADLLIQALTEILLYERVHCSLRLTPSDSKLRAELHEHQAVLQETFDELTGDCLIEILLPKRVYDRLFTH
jgi:GTPase